MSFRRQDKFNILTPQVLLLLSYTAFLPCTMLSSPNQGVSSLQTIVYSCLGATENVFLCIQAFLLVLVEQPRARKG